MNIFVYTSMRTLWSLGKFDQAPKLFSKVNKNKVPIIALIVTMIFAAFALITSYVAAGNKVEDLKYRVRWFPFVPIAGTVLYFLMLVGMGFDPTQRSALYFGIPVYVLIYIGFIMYQKKKAKTVQLNS